MLRVFLPRSALQRFAPLAVPSGFAAAWTVALATVTIPSSIDWKVVLMVVVLGTAVATLLTLPMVDPSLQEWGIGAGILAAMLAPFGASITVLALFAYAGGGLGPGWERSETVIPALAVQVLALMAIVAGLTLQRRDRPDASHRMGRWIAVGGTLAGTSALAVHLILTARDVL